MIRHPKLAILLCVLSMSGCATVMQDHHQSSVDANYNFNKAQTIIVLPTKKNNLETEYYIPDVVENLKELGFKNVYPYNKKDQIPSPIDSVIFVMLSNETSSYEENAPIYGLVDTGSTVSCSSFFSTVNCTENKKQTLGVTGYTKDTNYLTGYYFGLAWYSIKPWQKVFELFASSYDDQCKKNKLYDFLVKENIKRLDLTKPTDYKYKVKMPHGYDCRT